MFTDVMIMIFIRYHSPGSNDQKGHTIRDGGELAGGSSTRASGMTSSKPKRYQAVRSTFASTGRVGIEGQSISIGPWGWGYGMVWNGGKKRTHTRSSVAMTMMMKFLRGVSVLGRFLFLSCNGKWRRPVPDQIEIFSFRFTGMVQHNACVVVRWWIMIFPLFLVVSYQEGFKHK